MNIKIDKDGCLWIERAGKWKQQQCPYGDVELQNRYGHVPTPCSDDCPEWEIVETPNTGVEYSSTGQEELRICGGVTLVGTITDERVSPAQPATHGKEVKE